MRKVLFLTLLVFSGVARAQFYTIQPLKPHDPAKKEKKAEKVMTEFKARDSDPKGKLDFFPLEKGKKVEIDIEKDIPLFVNATDSLMFGLLSKRMNVCLPLDFLRMNSDYGYRRDPFSKCCRFHDGIDLQCKYARVYAMLPAIVQKVYFSRRGYGNYVVLDHGDFRCLYGHLSAITVRQGQEIPAGTVVGISGNSGRSTGPHLHIRMTREDGKSINPEPFIAYMNKYIGRLQEEMACLRFGTKPDKELNLASLYHILEKYDLKFKKIVMAQAILETGYFSSPVCTEYNNLFGLRRPDDGRYYEFRRWEDSVKAYRDYVQYKYKGGDYYVFLNEIGYASDTNYVSQVRRIAENL